MTCKSACYYTMRVYRNRSIRYLMGVKRENKDLYCFLLKLFVLTGHVLQFNNRGWLSKGHFFFLGLVVFQLIYDKNQIFVLFLNLLKCPRKPNFACFEYLGKKKTTWIHACCLNPCQVRSFLSLFSCWSWVRVRDPLHISGIPNYSNIGNKLVSSVAKCWNVLVLCQWLGAAIHLTLKNKTKQTKTEHKKRNYNKTSWRWIFGFYCF